MHNRFRYMLVLAILLFGAIKVSAQISMPDYVCAGTAKHYNVDPNPVPGSTYSWKIDGVAQESITNDVFITWNSRGTFLLEVTESSADGCLGPVRSGQVFVNSKVAPIFDAIGPLRQNALPPELTTTSKNSITGTWNPNRISTAQVGSATYTFTPDPGQCAATATLVISTGIGAVISGETLAGTCQQVKLDATKSIGDNLKYEWSIVGQGGELTRQTGITTEFFLSSLHTGSLPADFRVRLVLTDSQGNTDSDSITIKVDRPPAAEVYTSGKLETDGTLIVDGSVSRGTALSYKWHTSEGKIIGSDNQPVARLFGTGTYILEITDNHGCKSATSFKFPAEIYKILVNPDFVKTSWVKDTAINVLANDQSFFDLLPGKVRVIKPAVLGKTRVNANGSITYTPYSRRLGRDQFVYEVCDTAALCGSATVTIDIYESRIVIPGGFSPNGDGVNERLIFGGLQNYLKSKLYIYTRSGLIVYQSIDYQNDWDGTTIVNTLTKRKLVPTGVYYFILKPGGADLPVKGFIYIGY